MANKVELARCPSCQVAIFEDHTYPWCSECGEPLPEDIRAVIPSQRRLVAEAAPIAELASKRTDTGDLATSAKTRLVTAIFIVTFLLVVPRTECYWQRLGGLVLPVMGLLIFGAFVLAVVKLVASIRFAIRTWSRRKLRATLPALVYLVMILDAITRPYRISCEAFQSPVVKRACYEGTMRDITLRLRENGDFERQYIGWFAYSTFKSGAWHQDGDTLRLAFSSEPLVERYVWKGDTLLPIAEPGEESYPRHFLKGWCRGEN